MIYPKCISRQFYLLIIFMMVCSVFPAAVGAQGKIAFTSEMSGNREIFVMDSDGQNQTRLTTDPASDFNPSFSGGGGKIAFNSDRDGNSEIYVIGSNGTNETRLTNNSAPDFDPSFSPDGSKIAFVSNRNGNFEIYVMNSDGSGQINLSNDASPDLEPSFSYDGTKIVFVRGDEVYVMNADGSNQTRLTFSAGLDGDAAFSPDGSKIVFWSTRGVDDDIYVMNSDGSNQIRLTFNPAADFDPVFSPDGTQIAFVTNRDGDNEIYVMNAQGGSPQRLTINPLSDNNPTWSDGSLFPPRLSNVNLTPAQIPEGGTVTLSGNISSPNLSTTLTVRWYDGSPEQVFIYPAGTTSFSETHLYRDNRFELPYQVDVTLANANGADSKQPSVMVVNEPPVLSVMPVPPTVVGSPVELRGSVNDPGVLDTQTVRINWGDGSLQVQATLPAGVTTFATNHIYPAPGAYTITISATDDDGGTAIPVNQIVGIVPPPTSGRIAFTSSFGGNNNIWLMNSNGTGQVALTVNPAGDAFPNLSRDGSKITFASDRDGNSEIYSMNAAGAFQTRLTNNAAQDTTPAYSPDGSRIAFVSNRDGNFEIYIMNANGSGLQRLTTSQQDDGQPTFSPDGTKILFARLALNQSDSHIYSMNTDGTGQTPLTTGSFVLNGYPNFSPDGTRIVFSSVRPFSHTDGEIYVMNANGTGQTRLTVSGGHDREPVFSPNGSNIAFRSERTGNPEIFLIDANGANAQRITFDGPGINNFAPSWSDVSLLNVDVPDNLAAEQGATLTVPIIVSDTTGKGVISYDFALNFDPAVLQPLPVAFDKAGTLSAGFEVNAGTGTPGRVVVSGFGAAPLSGAGTLINLKFNVIGTAPTTSLLTLNPFRFNEGIPFVEVLGGQVFVQGTIRGTVRYGTSATPVGVPGVALSGVGSPDVSTSTAADGTYRLAGFGSGAYTVTPTKTGQVNGITAFDASLISQFLVGTAQLNANQLTAADVSGDGSVSSFDAALIAQYVVAIPNTGNAGIWRFAPPSRSYVTVGSLIGEDYAAILIGEVSGNWNASAAALNSLNTVAASGKDPISSPARPPGGGRTPEVSIGQIRATPGQTLAIPVALTYPAGTIALRAYQFDLSYDPAVIVPDTTGADGTGTLSSGFAVVTNTTTPGRLRIAVFGSGSIGGNGTLLNLKFRVVGGRNSTSALTIGDLLLNEGNPVGAVKNGSVTVRR